MTDSVIDQAKRAKIAARRLSAASAEVKNRALYRIADTLEARALLIQDANCADLAAARNAGLSEALLDRLALNERRIGAMAEGLRQIAALPDPVGQIVDGSRRPNGLDLERVRVPLGVIGIIYESRPNVTIDAAGLCLKSGNAAILRGGSEALQSNLALTCLFAEEAAKAGLPEDAVQLIGTSDREAALTLMRAEGLVDVLIVRGGNALKKSVLDNARVPVLASLGGNCHTYVDLSADLHMAADIAFNAKVSRPSVCNAMETLLVHSSIAERLLADLAPRLLAAGVEIRGCDRTRAAVPRALAATEADWATEFLSLTLAIRVVGSLEEALDHIAMYGSGHSEAIVTRDYSASQRFVQDVDAACVYVNASTRFTDGFEFGLGAEVGISTQKLHARGPIGLADLTTIKTVIRGNGQIRE
jgi:glutamate-5-semialdehyde dehydrogenase